MSFDEKAFEETLKHQRFVTAEPSVKFDRSKSKFQYEAEIMFAGGQWTLDNHFIDRDEARKFSEAKCKEINNRLKTLASEMVSGMGLKKAKP